MSILTYNTERTLRLVRDSDECETETECIGVCNLYNNALYINIKILYNNSHNKDYK